MGVYDGIATNIGQKSRRNSSDSIMQQYIRNQNKFVVEVLYLKTSLRVKTVGKRNRKRNHLKVELYRELRSSLAFFSPEMKNNRGCKGHRYEESPGFRAQYYRNSR